MQSDSNPGTPILWRNEKGELVLKSDGDPQRLLADLLLVLNEWLFIALVLNDPAIEEMHDHIQKACAAHPLLARVVKDSATETMGSSCPN